jgi:hypothetical protein
MVVGGRISRSKMLLQVRKAVARSGLRASGVDSTFR